MQEVTRIEVSTIRVATELICQAVADARQRMGSDLTDDDYAHAVFFDDKDRSIPAKIVVYDTTATEEGTSVVAEIEVPWATNV